MRATRGSKQKANLQHSYYKSTTRQPELPSVLRASILSMKRWTKVTRYLKNTTNRRDRHQTNKQKRKRKTVDVGNRRNLKIIGNFGEKRIHSLKKKKVLEKNAIQKIIYGR